MKNTGDERNDLNKDKSADEQIVHDNSNEANSKNPDENSYRTVRYRATSAVLTHDNSDSPDSPKTTISLLFCVLTPLISVYSVMIFLILCCK